MFICFKNPNLLSKIKILVKKPNPLQKYFLRSKFGFKSKFSKILFYIKIIYFRKKCRQDTVTRTTPDIALTHHLGGYKGGALM